MIARPKFPLRLTAASAMVVASITLGGLAGCGGGSDTVAPVKPPLIEAEATTGSKVLSWFERIAESLYEVALGVAAIAEGNVAAGVAEFAAAGLGVISKGLESDGTGGDAQAKQLTEIDTKLDTLIVTVQSIASQVVAVEQQVASLAATDANVAAMNTPMVNAQTWLTTYYTDPAGSTTSREWVRWVLAGCDPKAAACSSANNPVTADRLAAFRAAYMKHPEKDTLAQVSDNFPLWWAYSVIGGQTVGSTNYTAGGFLASQLVDTIYYGLTNNKGTAANGLLSYMNFLMAQSSNTCYVDVTDAKCDLYTNVYLPLESYFQSAISRQSQLVMALSEADTVLAQKSPDVYGSAGATLMARFNKQLNEEVEIFLQVAEQIALYRAADGRSDWSNFASTDAGKLLARADFVVAQLAGKNYVPNNTINANTATAAFQYTSSPWPSSGVVGRVFYAHGEPMLAGTGTRSVCSNANPQLCSNPLTQIGENTPMQRTVTGAQPYLLWKNTVDAKGAVTLMTGTANTLWSVQRLMPLATPTLAVGADYRVNSMQPTARMPAKLSFYNYDENFVKQTTPGAASVTPFGSFNSVEGAIGRYGVKLDAASFTGSTDMSATLFDDSYSASTVNPGAMSYSVTYVPNKHYNGNNWSGLGTTAGSWSAATAVKLAIPETIATSATKVKISWPSTLDVSLDSAYQLTSGLGGNGAGREEYYSYVKFKQHIQDSKGNELTLSSGKSSVANADCTSAPFFSCQIDENQSVDLTMLTANLTDNATGANLSFSAKFSTEVDQYDKRVVWFNKYETVRTSLAPSVAAWDIQAPMFTLIK